MCVCVCIYKAKVKCPTVHGHAGIKGRIGGTSITHRWKQLSNIGRENTEKIFGPVKENGVWRMRSTNEVLMDLYREPAIISEIT